MTLAVLRSTDEVFYSIALNQDLFAFLFLNKFIYFIYLFLAALGLCCCTRAFSSCSERGLLFVAVHVLLIAVDSLIFSCCRAWALGARASVVVAHGLSSCGAWAQLLHDMWDLPRPGLKPVSLALAGGFFFFFLIYLFIYLLFLAVLGLRFCVRAFSSCSKRGPLFITVRGPLTVLASLVAEHRLQTRRLSSCGSRVQLLRGMWDLPRPGLEPVSPALAGRFSTTAPPGKPWQVDS